MEPLESTAIMILCSHIQTLVDFLKHSALILVIGAVYRLTGRSGPLERALALATKAVVPDRRAPVPMR